MRNSTPNQRGTQITDLSDIIGWYSLDSQHGGLIGILAFLISGTQRKIKTIMRLRDIKREKNGLKRVIKM